MITTAPPVPRNVADTLRELGRFFRLAREAGPSERLPMFSGYVDAAWQRLLESPTVYGRFCDRHAGQPVTHVPWADTGTVPWVEEYHAAFGPLPDIWFADASGTVDHELLAAYRSTGSVVTSWDCYPQMPEDDGEKDGGTAPPRPTRSAWELAPAGSRR